MDNAYDRVGTVVDQGTKDYAIVVSQNPEPHFYCYAVRNKATLVDEYLSSNLAKARYVVVEMQRDLDEGYDRHVNTQGLVGGALNG